MASKSLEERIERLEKENRQLKDIYEIHNLMGKYEYLHSAMLDKEQVALFAQKTPDVSANIGDWGNYKGINGIKKLYMGVMGGGPQPGFMFEHDLTTPVIEVAKDGKTAKGVWMSPGHETYKDEATGKILNGWCWLKYACDFIKEDGEWKIWHLNTFLTFWAFYEKGWAEGGKHVLGVNFVRTRQKNDDNKPDGPGVIREMAYHPDAKPALLPAFPEPYDTYDGNMHWMDPQNKRK